MNSLARSAPRRREGDRSSAAHRHVVLVERDHELDEHVLEAGLAPARRVMPVRCGVSLRASSASFADRRPTTCSVAPNGATCSTPCAPTSAFTSSALGFAADDEGREAGIADDLVDRAGREQLAIGDVADAVAALGLVHVVGRDEHGQARRRQPVDLVPEFAPRLGVDAGGRLVEQQQLRLVHDAGGERQALLPAARQRAGELVAPRASGRARRASRRPSRARGSRS